MVRNVRKSRSPFARVHHTKGTEGERDGEKERDRAKERAPRGERKKVLYMGVTYAHTEPS